jgi:hypothetical protein
MTEARVRAVMRKVEANFRAFITAGLITEAHASSWTADVTYLQLVEALDYFEVQCATPEGASFGLRYRVAADGSIREDSRSGGLDVYGIPRNSRVRLYAHLRNGIGSSVREELRKRGWGFDGSSLEGPESEQRSFSREGYGVTRSKVGVWP